jgi:hypothetical protein
MPDMTSQLAAGVVLLAFVGQLGSGNFQIKTDRVEVAQQRPAIDAEGDFAPNAVGACLTLMISPFSSQRAGSEGGMQGVGADVFFKAYA